MLVLLLSRNVFIQIRVKVGGETLRTGGMPRATEELVSR
jgi:hypothetical protein